MTSLNSKTLDQIKKILVERFAIDPAKITPAVDLQKELNLDSLDAVDLLFAINETFRTRIPTKSLDNVYTLAQLVQLVDQQSVKKRPG